MATITLEVSEDVADRLRRIPEAELASFLKEIVEEYETGSPADSLSLPLTEEDLAAIGEGLADAEAGRVTSGPEFFRKLRQRVGLPN